MRKQQVHSVASDNETTSPITTDTGPLNRVVLALDECSPRASPELSNVLAEIALTNAQLEVVFASVDALERVVQNASLEVERHEVALGQAEESMRERVQPSRASQALTSFTGGLWRGARTSSIAQVVLPPKPQATFALKEYDTFSNVRELCQSAHGKALGQSKYCVE